MHTSSCSGQLPDAYNRILQSCLSVKIHGLDVAFEIIKETPFGFSAHWTLTAIPMFLLMGSLAYHSGMSGSLFRAASYSRILVTV